MIESATRIMIIGQPGSGKSTLARQLGEVLRLPVVHIDHIHWQAGWVERPNAEKDALCAEVHASEQWIFEGGRSPTWPERLDRADALVWLDVPFIIRAWRVFLRTVKHHGRTRPDLPSGCPERFDRKFTYWIWSTRKSGRTKARALFDSVPPHKEAIRLSTSREVREWLAAVSENAAAITR